MAEFCDVCVSKRCAFKKTGDDRSTLPGRCFKNCVHLHLDSHNIKVFATCAQINHARLPPDEIARKLVDHARWKNMVLFPVMNSVTYDTRLSRRVCTYRFIRALNETLENYHATYWPKKTGRNGIQIHYLKACLYPVYIVQKRNTTKRDISKSGPFFTMYKSGVLVTSMHDARVLGVLAKWINDNKDKF